MKRFQVLMVMVMAAMLSACCDVPVTGDAMDAAGEISTMPDAGGDVVARDVNEPAFCAGRPSAGEGLPEQYRGAIDSDSCACEQARGDKTCSNPGSQCIGTPSQPAALGCHQPCDTTNPDRPCMGGYTCVEGFCWYLCAPTVVYDCPPTMQCVPYRNPLAGTAHVCVPQLGYVPR